MISTVLATIGLRGKTFKFNLHVIGFVLLFTAAMAGIMGMLTAQLANDEAVPWVAVAATRGVATISWAIFGLTAAYVVFGILVNGMNKVKNAVKIEDEIEVPEQEVIDVNEAAKIMPQYGSIIRNGEQLNTALREIATGRSSAKARAADAKQIAGALAGLIKGAVDRANEIDVETQALRGAMKAVRSRDRVAMSYYIGALNDSTLTRLIETAMARNDMISGVLESFAAEAGAMATQSRATLALAKSWVDILKEARAELARIETVAMELGAASEIISIDASLTTAMDSLRLSTASPIAIAVAERGLPVVPGTPRHDFATAQIEHPETRYIGAPQ